MSDSSFSYLYKWTAKETNQNPAFHCKPFQP